MFSRRLMPTLKKDIDSKLPAFVSHTKFESARPLKPVQVFPPA